MALVLLEALVLVRLQPQPLRHLHQLPPARVLLSQPLRLPDVALSFLPVLIA